MNMALYTESQMTPRRGTKASVDCDSSAHMLDAAVLAGLIVVPGAAGDSAKLPASDADIPKALGVVAYDQAAQPTSASYDFAAGEVAEVVYRGDVWVVCEDAIAAGAQVYLRHTANGAGKLQPGAVCAADDTTYTALLPNARALAASSGAGVIKLRVNFPYGAAA